MKSLQSLDSFLFDFCCVTMSTPKHSLPSVSKCASQTPDKKGSFVKRLPMVTPYVYSKVRQMCCVCKHSPRNHFIVDSPMPSSPNVALGLLKGMSKNQPSPMSTPSASRRSPSLLKKVLTAMASPLKMTFKKDQQQERRATRAQTRHFIRSDSVRKVDTPTIVDNDTPNERMTFVVRQCTPLGTSTPTGRLPKTLASKTKLISRKYKRATLVSSAKSNTNIQNGERCPSMSTGNGGNVQCTSHFKGDLDGPQFSPYNLRHKNCTHARKRLPTPVVQTMGPPKLPLEVAKSKAVNKKIYQIAKSRMYSRKTCTLSKKKNNSTSKIRRSISTRHTLKSFRF